LINAISVEEELGRAQSKPTLGLSLLRNRGLAAKDILLDLAGGCFRQLGHKLDSLGTLEVRQMITSVIAQLSFRRGRACLQDDKCVGRLAPPLVRHSDDCHLLNSWMSQIHAS